MYHNVNIYNTLYENSRYDSLNSCKQKYKYQFVEQFLEKYSKKDIVLDVGSGRGFNTKQFLDIGKTVIAVDFCDIIETYEPHSSLTTYKMDVLEFIDVVKGTIPRNKSMVISTDFLEHMDPGCIHDVVSGLSQLSSVAFFGIANHSDRTSFGELHLIRETSNWWAELFGNYYRGVDLISTKYEGRFFCFDCSGAK